MATVQARPLAKLTREAIALLSMQMGVVNTVRFINQFTTGYGDYTEERRQAFADLTFDDIVAEIKRRKADGDKGA